MRIHADLDSCEGHAQCEDAAPDVFRVGDDGIVEVLIEFPGEELRAEVEAAALRCPASVIKVVD